MNVEDALFKLGDSVSEAVAGVMRSYVGEAAERGPMEILDPGSDPLSALTVPAVAGSVSYVGDVTGGNVLVMPLQAARALAAALIGEAPPEDETGEVTERELSAAGEAVNRMMAAAASATAAVLGTEVEIGVPDTRVLESLDGALDGHGDAAHITSAVFTLFGLPCRLVHLVPDGFVTRMTEALDELGTEYRTALGADGTSGLDDSLRGVRVRVSAELGRRRMPIGSLVGTAPGAVLELDRQAEEPVDLYVNGLRFATARLVVSDDGDWAVRIESLVGEAPAPA